MNFKGFAPRLVAALGVAAVFSVSQAAHAVSLTVDLGLIDHPAAPLSSFTAASPNPLGGTPATAEFTNFAGPTIDNILFPGLDSGDGVTGSLSAVNTANGFGFTAGGGPFAGDPLLGDYFASRPGGAPTYTISSLTGLSAGDEVSVVAYSIGDNANQVGSISITYNGVTSPVTQTSVGTPFAVNSFIYVDGVDTLDINIGNPDGTFQALNGFSISVIPEPASVSLLALGCLGALTRRRS